MENVHYVNTGDNGRGETKKENVPSGGSKIFMLVGVSFGLLCIIQAALNVSLRLQAGISNKIPSNVTMMSSDDISNLIMERDELIQETNQLNQDKNLLLQMNSQLNEIQQQLNREKATLVQEKEQLKREKATLVQEKEQLKREKATLVQEKEQLKREKETLVQEKEQLNREKATLVQEKEQLKREKSTLVQEKEQLNREKEMLVQEKNQLHQDKDQLEKDKKELQGINTNQQLQIQELRAQNTAPNAQGCPQGWVRFQLSCYQVSSHENTWYFAKQDCESKGAHLVIINGQQEESNIRTIGSFDFSGVTMWLGVSSHYDPDTYSWIWKWVDGSWFNNPEIFQISHLPGSFAWCIYLHTPVHNGLIPDNCQALHYWVCEKELQSSPFRLK
ncbi:oxidized low-density lipoprotein receptor 1-like isoform X2 [Parambassis ranga]|uniref:Oxidized low-density lipoprotein receptor 1-like isoform X2 n=1 Tax=Parambassis ranga TaxID=210632 RepID=A0A6P7JXS5_9TELE|nr:oxidized low-density lipoprotein receptor 1-like isoform X2 [Parambassis ranga]